MVGFSQIQRRETIQIGKEEGVRREYLARRLIPHLQEFGGSCGTMAKILFTQATL